MLELKNNCIIAAVRDLDEFEQALSSAPENIFLLSSNILQLPKCIKAAHENNKKLFIHFDLADGVGKDKAGLMFIAKLGADGIISTRTNIIKTARLCKLCTVQRFFIVDSKSELTAFESIKSSKPDMVEFLPGVIPKVIKSFSDNLDIPIISGGLIETEDEIKNIFSAGASAVSTGKQELWNVEIE